MIVNGRVQLEDGTTRLHIDAGPSSPTLLVEIAWDWLENKRDAETAKQRSVGHSHRGRAQDLALLGRAVQHVSGRREEPLFEQPVVAGAPKRRLRGLSIDADLADVTPSDLNRDHLRAAIRMINGRYEPGSVVKIMTTWRQYLAYLCELGVCEDNPLTGASKLPAPKLAGRENLALAVGQIEAIAAAAKEGDPRSKVRWPARDMALVAMLFGCGGRAGENCDTRIGDIRFSDTSMWHVRSGKGAKSRVVPMPSWAADAVAGYLHERQERFGPAKSTDPLWLRADGRALREPNLDWLLRKLAQQANVGLPKGAAAHAFRHAYGVKLAFAGVPETVIAQTLGHGDTRTVAVYTQMTPELIARSLEDAGVL